MVEASHLQEQLASLLIYARIFQTSVGAAFAQALDQTSHYQDNPTRLHQITAQKAYGVWFSLICQKAESWGQWIESQILFQANAFATQCLRHTSVNVSEHLKIAVQHDLAILEQVATQGSSIICPEESVAIAPYSANELTFFAANQSWAEQYLPLGDYYHHHGTGVIAQYKALRWSEGVLTGIAQPDSIRLHELVGYDRQKERLCRNTEALLAGFPALNVLLYGCRGAGKSALVKALVHEYGDRGLRLIELSKADLIHLPNIVEAIANAPQKFIFFVDDLSFEEDEESYKALKVVLEGTVTARPPNVVVYATSNRRHLIREFFADRPRPSDADEIHHWDTVQEKLSLSDRFGLSLTFSPADQDIYLEMVFHLAQLQRLTINPEDLKFRALQWATQQNGRSGRTARQFIQALAAELTQLEPEGRFV